LPAVILSDSLSVNGGRSDSSESPQRFRFRVADAPTLGGNGGKELEMGVSAGLGRLRCCTASG